ncbi:MAG: hypothetical protein LUD17_06500 [Bacteroidales bacterium]|nr:hypothetical protein [Bacteroidales bacterium]
MLLKMVMLGLALSIGPVSLYAQEDAPVNAQQEGQDETQESPIAEVIIGLLESGKWFAFSYEFGWSKNICGENC